MSNVNQYRQNKEAKNEVHETPVDRKKKTEYKMVKVNNELHEELKIKAATQGITMQEFTERAIREKLDQYLN
ncbi:toxin-antitoxin system HicB family antitoxin [Staphylococcus xylosus]|uniref:Toxin-antitoxin system HicB family antitoxin n=1 Tax=Staphylococcus xylosus TaxID=1288 RepID=A0AAQ0RWF8_STAXY|nr:toxin-antitoxin system HicB family antitoxin [Staphylococcus xylosus]RIM90976.1 toxin-antitoxin system HicB family antitoxin [Staphylococcus xylosus]